VLPQFAAHNGTAQDREIDVFSGDDITVATLDGRKFVGANAEVSEVTKTS